MNKINFSIILSFLVLFLLLSCDKSSTNNTNQDSQDWVKYNTDKDGNVYLYKKLHFVKNGRKIVHLLRKTVFSDKGREKEIQFLKKQGAPTKRFDRLYEVQVTNEIDCKKQTGRIVRISYYNSVGEILLYDDKNKSDYIIPDSEREVFLKEICM